MLNLDRNGLFGLS
jgi:hypothetical protein